DPTAGAASGSARARSSSNRSPTPPRSCGRSAACIVRACSGCCRSSRSRRWRGARPRARSSTPRGRRGTGTSSSTARAPTRIWFTPGARRIRSTPNSSGWPSRGCSRSSTIARWGRRGPPTAHGLRRRRRRLVTATRPFDLRAVSLDGLQVIEASAGTGKTRTITGLYLRLVMEKKVPLERILVVTYTVAATEELRERIRDVLVQALAALRGRAVTDEMAVELTAHVDDRATAALWVQQALANFDLAGIHPIHGFCQRALADGAFESGLPFDRELVPDVSDLVREVVDDYWRTRVVDAPTLFVQYLLDEHITPERLAM